jgi:hypothetical protein
MPASVMLIDRAIAAYQDLVRIVGWTGNAALMVEATAPGGNAILARRKTRNPGQRVAPVAGAAGAVTR